MDESGEVNKDSMGPQSQSQQVLLAFYLGYMRYWIILRWLTLEQRQILWRPVTLRMSGDRISFEGFILLVPDMQDYKSPMS